jgi:ATP-binding cassette subfamily B protein
MHASQSRPSRAVQSPLETYLREINSTALLTADEVWQAARGADLADTIEDLPARLETIVGERGVTLSGGQKQRATLTRGLIRDAAVLLLDDCFSSVDTQTEERILRSLKQRRGRHTTILVSHRVSTARHADQIVVLEDGAVLEQGSHEALLARGGWYADLERIQNPDGTGRGPGIRADEVTAGE